MEKKESLATLFGERVKTLRQETTEMSQEGFALYVGLERSQYARIERGENDIRLSTIVKIANGFGLTAAELLDGIVVEDEPLYEVNPIRKKSGSSVLIILRDEVVTASSRIRNNIVTDS